LQGKARDDGLRECCKVGMIGKWERLLRDDELINVAKSASE